jgi:hypothetical protein
VVLGRFLYRGQTQAMLQLAAQVRVDSGCTGEVRFTLTSGATATLPFSASGTLRTQLPIDAEDLTATDGRRSARTERVLVELRRTAGSSLVYLDTVNGGEGTLATSSALSAARTAKRSVWGMGPLPHFMGGKRRR